MKTIFKFILIAIVAVGCSTEEMPQQVETNSINPPAWTHGVWAQDMFGQLVPAYKFTENEFCQISMAGYHHCWVEQMELTNGGFSVEEQEIEDTYTISANNLSGLTFTFTRISATKIEWNGIELTKVQ